MSLQRKVATVLIVLLLSVGFVGGLVAFANGDLQYKTFTSKEFGFSISYPKSWDKGLRKVDGRQVYRTTTLILSSPAELSAGVSVSVKELAEAPSPDELKRYYELRAKLAPEMGVTEVKLGRFAGTKAVIVKITRTSFYKETVTGKSGKEESKWKKTERTWKGKLVGVIKDGFFYRISAGSFLDTYEESNEKYLEKILGSFEFKKISG